MFRDTTFSGLLLDYELASQLENNKKKIFYQSLVKPVNGAVDSYGIENSLEYSKLSEIKLTRKELKSLMTIMLQRLK